MNTKKEVIVLTGAGQIGLAIVRRVGYIKKIIVADWKLDNAGNISRVLNEAGYDASAVQVDISSKADVMHLISTAQKEGDIVMLINAAGVSPSQATVTQILNVDLYGTALLLEEFGKVIKAGGAGVTISSQSGYRMPALSAKADRDLAITAVDDLLGLQILNAENINDTLHAYQLAKRGNVKRVMAEAVKWGKRGARINSISPGIIITPLALDEINGPRGNFYSHMFANCPAGRAGTADEVAALAELLLTNAGAYITGSDFLIDGGATASYFYGPLQPE